MYINNIVAAYYCVIRIQYKNADNTKNFENCRATCSEYCNESRISLTFFKN